MDRLFTTAEEEAELLGDEKPSAEHLILAALQLPEDSAAGVFARVGADPADFRRALVAEHDERRRSIDAEPDDARRTTPSHSFRPNRPSRAAASARELFSTVADIIRAEGSHIYGAHILLAAAGIDEGTTPRTFAAMGIDRSALAAAARTEIDLRNEVRPA